MQFRNHRILVCDGVMTWPPKWVQSYGPGNNFVSGEVGVLDAVFLSKVFMNKVCLLIHTEEGNAYIGSISFENADSAKTVFEFLYDRIGNPIQSIGSMDLSDDCSNPHR